MVAIKNTSFILYPTTITYIRNFTLQRPQVSYICMGKKKKKKVFNSHKVQKAINRKEEIEEHGKLISLRPGKVFKSGKEYKRLKINKNNYYDTDIA